MKHHRARLFCLLLALCLAVSAAGCSAHAAATDPYAALPTVLVGCDTYPPYSYTGADGQPTGIDIELATEAFHRMGYRPRFTTIDWEVKKDLVEAGTIDCIWSSFSMNGRRDDYRWAGPYMISRQVVAVLPESDIHTIADLAGKNIAVQATTKPEELFLDPAAGLPAIRTLFSLQNRELLSPYLSKGYADAIAGHETSIRQYMADYDIEFRILDEPLLVVGLGVAFAKDDTRGLDTALSDVLAEMRADGTTAEIVGRYLDNPAAYLEVDAYAE